jgi:hypothetical protein
MENDAYSDRKLHNRLLPLARADYRRQLKPDDVEAFAFPSDVLEQCSDAADGYWLTFHGTCIHRRRIGRIHVIRRRNGWSKKFDPTTASFSVSVQEHTSRAASIGLHYCSFPDGAFVDTAREHSSLIKAILLTVSSLSTA